MVFDDYDGQLVSGGKCDLNLLIFISQLWENLNQKTDPTENQEVMTLLLNHNGGRQLFKKCAFTWQSSLLEIAAISSAFSLKNYGRTISL